MKRRWMPHGPTSVGDWSISDPAETYTARGEEALDDELRYLRAEIYRYPDADPPIKRLTAFDRFQA